MRIAAIALLGFFAAACQSEQVGPENSDGVVRWQLPNKLREISGLALTSDERLLAVTDEEAIVYEIDYRNGRLVKAFAVGNPSVRGDFEGIAVLGDKIWLMASNGRLYSFSEGADGKRVDYERIKTDLDDQCEFEGLTADLQSGRLLLVCKESLKKRKGLRIFEWLAEGGNEGNVVEIDLAEGDMIDNIDGKRVNPSGITIDRNNGNLIVVAAKQHSVFELSRDGRLLDVIMRLDPRRHRQAEGIAITSDGRLLIVDEAGSGRARLTVYPPEQQE